MIEASRLGFGYHERPVLTDVTFRVSRGEFFGVIGPNGSGKSTLLKLLSGLLPPRQGRVSLSGRDLREYPPRELARRIAVVPQETQVAFPFSALDVVLMGRSPHLHLLQLEKEADRGIARWAMAQTDTQHLASRVIQELSGGEKQRVILARALAQQAGLLILDEPTAFLDIRHQVEFCRLLRRLCRRQGLTTVVVFHDLNLASNYCQRILLLREGSVFRIGTPQEVITYASIKAVYGAEVYVGLNDLTGLPYYVPMQGMEEPDAEETQGSGNGSPAWKT